LSGGVSAAARVNERLANGPAARTSILDAGPISFHGGNKTSPCKFWAVSDVNTEELQEFVEKFQAAARAGGI
jgi:anti-sigma factor RsiW